VGGSINRISSGMWPIGVPRPGRHLPNLPIKHTTQQQSFVSIPGMEGAGKKITEGI
jgi:hypothetical protein